MAHRRLRRRRHTVAGRVAVAGHGDDDALARLGARYTQKDLKDLLNAVETFLGAVRLL
jgi:hypothetical protein